LSPQSPTGLQALSAALAEWLYAYTLATEPFKPLSMLGVPGSWRASEKPPFYADTRVFRLQRKC